MRNEMEMVRLVRHVRGTHCPALIKVRSGGARASEMVTVVASARSNFLTVEGFI